MNTCAKFTRYRNVESNSWFYRPKPLAEPKLRLFCFPYAGGSANSYREWPNRLPTGVEMWAIELPGHQRRFDEQLFNNFDSLLDELQREILFHNDIPYTFFGHSFGAQIAFALAHRLSHISYRKPNWLFLSGMRPRNRTRDNELMHLLPDDEFINKLAKLGGIPEILLKESDLLDLMLPILRSDVAMSEMWQSTIVESLVIGITALGGIEDSEVNIDDLGAWEQETEGPFRMHTFPGGHFFIHSHHDLVLDVIHDELASLIV